MCGKPLVVPEGPAGPSASVEQAPATGTPWERRDELGLLSAWAQTVQMALFEPGRLFRAARLDRNADQFWFALLTGSVFWGIAQLLQRLLASRTNEMLKQLAAEAGDNPLIKAMMERQEKLGTAAWTIGLLLATPIFTAILIYVNAGVTHLFTMLFGQSRKGFAATFAACAYAFAPTVLLAIPGCGSLIALFWMVVLIGIGLKETHGIGAGGATAAVLAPYLLFCCLCGALISMIAFTLAHVVGQ